MPKKELNAIAQAIIDGLKEHVIIHRYDAYSTNSIYLKFDYGVANSLRISDHPGKKHLAYRFNLILDQSGREPYVSVRNGYPMYFYPPEAVDMLIEAILDAREKKIAQCTSYAAVVRKASDSIDPSVGFWRGAKEVPA